ncbi:hypothetical protein [Xanthomonas vesicatoria]|uniref:Uncharacterized protein n=1 Tax=Xanthomonas vesicatoria ATCC 35937 TaxID=925775 RepID=F0BF68_9XANT|nr:hypothetical protein [Xanthomonas vesicatoria]APP77514.1 hypothetical protein BJD12_00420 [Xanthomonas vesicatoria ATCC 35937]EGD07657.1 hypothetical protein XVE_4119 [Xanthomonas vesicatoria ATCC 35937]EGD08871.1 hypothetical protein XVE_2848 [Xanthomonas vesicatoria ATCC 35937]KTF35310.1 hypothetical protein LMG920_03270 [Xanthomonas vesicatoria]MCC8597265.1 hypothetical protein [Xanthomonas vesicatoria]
MSSPLPTAASVLGLCDDFHVETLEMQVSDSSMWTSTVYIFHVRRSGPLLTIENAGRAEYRDDARRQAVAAGLAAIADIDPADY